MKRRKVKVIPKCFKDEKYWGVVYRNISAFGKTKLDAYMEFAIAMSLAFDILYDDVENLCAKSARNKAPQHKKWVGGK